MSSYLIFALFASAMSLVACAQLQRSSSSGQQPAVTETRYSGSMDQDSSRNAYELGMDANSSLSYDDRERIRSRQKLKEMEKTLRSSKEREQYSKVIPWFRNDSEKIEFLSIQGIEGRQQWINSHNIWDRAKMPGAEMKELIETQDIAVGMPQAYVKKSWGDPTSVEVSGNPIYRNERWKYQRFISSPDGYKKETRFVYFEGGRVVGWETE